MLNIFKTIVTKLGGIDTSESNHIDTYTEEKINTTEGSKIASSKNNGGIWISFQELAGYEYMNITVIGANNMKNFNGCILNFMNNETISLQLNSDTREIESNFSNVSNRWITDISFDITNSNIDVIKNNTASYIKLEYKKKFEFFDILKP